MQGEQPPSPPNEDELKAALENLSPEEAELFIRALELTLKRRRILVIGYLAALLTLIFGLASAAYAYGTRDPDTFMGWVFLVPFAAVGIILQVFGRLAKRGAPRPSKTTPSDSGASSG